VKLLGMVGGIGPESTIEYYRLLIGECPQLLIANIDLNRLLAFMNDDDLAAVAVYVGEAVQRLARAGAEVGLIAANTPHIVFHEIQQRSPIPLVSIVEATRDEAAARGLRRLAIFGTRFTVQAQFFPDVFARAGMAIVRPTAEEQNFMHEIYFGELVKGVFRDETRARLMDIVDAMRQRDAIDGVILGGTELPLILRDGDHAVPFLDTTRIHVRAALDRCRAGS
jgi:aspartate racemase